MTVLPLATYTRISEKVPFPSGASRLRLGVPAATAWGIEIGEDIEVLGFFREAGELLCTPAGRLAASGVEPLAAISALEGAHEGGASMPDLFSLPQAKELVAPDRLIRFQLKWAAKQFDLQFGKEVALRVTQSTTPIAVQVITWMGWMVLMSEERYKRFLDHPW